MQQTVSLFELIKSESKKEKYESAFNKLTELFKQEEKLEEFDQLQNEKTNVMKELLSLSKNALTNEWIEIVNSTNPNTNDFENEILTIIHDDIPTKEQFLYVTFIELAIDKIDQTKLVELIRNSVCYHSLNMLFSLSDTIFEKI